MELNVMVKKEPPLKLSAVDELVKKEMSFLVEEYGVEYGFQQFDLGGGWVISTHSFYTDSGCFTIHNIPGRGELNFYYSQHFSTDWYEICSKPVDVTSVETEIWNRHRKFLFIIPNIFFGFCEFKIIRALAEVIKAQTQKNHAFFGVKVNAKKS